MPFSVKCVFNSDIRRFQLPSVSLSHLRSSLHEAYGYDETRYIFKYEDDEQELVTITTQQELVEAINIVGNNKLLKLFVTLKEAPTTTTATAATKPRSTPTPSPAQVEAPAATIKETPKPAPVETAAPTSTPPPTTTTPTEQSKSSDKPLDLSDCRTCINLILELLSDPIFLRALPSLALAAIDAFVATQSFEKTLDAVINVNDGVKNHASIVALLPHARRYAPLADIKYAHAKGIIIDLLPMARQYVTLLPTFLPRVVEYLMSILEQWDRAEKEEVKEDGKDPMFSVLENVAQTVQSHPMVAPLLANLGIDPSAMIQQGWRCHPFAQMLRRGGGGGGGCPMRGGGWGGRRGGWGRRFEQPTTPQPNPAAAEPAGEQVHSNIICDMCNVNPIRGIRYKCTVCRDFDLCETCESTGRHPLDHPLIKIVKGKRVPEEEVHSGVACDGCRQYPIRGIRYKCSTCRDYDLCSSCESKNIHPAEHNLIKIKTPAVRPVDTGSSHHHHHGRYWDMNRARRYNHCPGWRISESETPATPATPTSSSSTPPSARFVRDANLTDRTEVAPNQTLVKTWVVSNSGERTWPTGSKLIFVRGDRQLSTEEEFLIPSATPGQQVEINAVLHTPATPGRYTAYFRLADAERNVFGPRVWVDLVVVGSDVTPTPAPVAATTTPSSVTVEDEPLVDDIKQAAAEDVQSAPTSSPATPTPVPAPAPAPAEPVAPPSPNHDDFVHVQAPEPVAASEPAAPAPPSASPAPAPTAATAAFESVFPIQNNALVSMGFTDRDLNEWVLNKHGGNLQNAANWLLERIKL